MVKLSADQKRLHQAAESDNVRATKLKEIIEKIVNSRDDLDLGRTPLHKAQFDKSGSYTKLLRWS